MSVQRPPAPTRVRWDTVQLLGDQIRITFPNGDYTEFSALNAKRLIDSTVLSSDDVRAIVRDELADQASQARGAPERRSSEQSASS